MSAARSKSYARFCRFGPTGFVIAAFLLAACASPPRQPPVATESDAEEIDPAPQPRFEAFGESAVIPSFKDMIRLRPDQQRAFLNFFHAPAQESFKPHRRVVNYLEKRLTDLAFDRRTTGAMETLDRRHGNCLSLALVTSAIAALAGVESEWVLTTADPVYSSEGGVVYSANHVHTRLYDPTYRPDPDVVTLRRPHIRLDYFTNRPSIVGGRALLPRQQAALTFQNLAAEAAAGDDVATALALALAGLEHDPDDADLYNTVGVLHRRVGETTLAEQFFRHSLAISGDRLVTLRNLRRLLVSQERGGEARALQARILALPDPDPYPLIELGNAALEDDPDSARAFYRRARQVAPYLHEVYWKLSLAERRLGDEEGARRAIRKALELAHSPAERKRYGAKLGPADVNGPTD